MGGTCKKMNSAEVRKVKFRFMCLAMEMEKNLKLLKQLFLETFLSFPLHFLFVLFSLFLY